MEKNFNLSRYKELLELEEKKEISFLNLELVTYKASVEAQIAYNRKKDYFILIYKYLSQLITPYEFRCDFLQMDKDDLTKSRRILKNFQKLEVFSFTKGLEEFSDLITEISALCLEFGETWDGTMEPMSESEFYSLINKYYFQLQETFFPFSIWERFGNAELYEQLVSRSFKVLIFTIGLTILFSLFFIRMIN
jgi:hypothetical protein